MRDEPGLFGHIDRVLHECDARQLPPLRPATMQVTDADGNTTTHQVMARLDPATNAHPEVVLPTDGRFTAPTTGTYSITSQPQTMPGRRRLLDWIPWRRP